MAKQLYLNLKTGKMTPCNALTVAGCTAHGHGKDGLAGGSGVPNGAQNPYLEGLDQSQLDAVFERFKQTQADEVLIIEDGDVYASSPAIADLTSKIAATDTLIEGLKELDDEAVVRVGDLGLDEKHVWSDDDIISKKEAIDLVRLEKAIAREERTKELYAIAEAEGLQVLSEYGEGALGIAEATGTFEPNTKEWLLNRAQGIGGSDKIGYLNEDNQFVPYEGGQLRHMLSTKTPEAIAKIEATARTEALKPGQVDESPLPIKIGNALERTIQFEFAVNNPQYNHLEDKSSRISSGRPWHRFNPDGVLQEKETGAYGIFEAKTSRDAETYAKALPGYKAQCLHNAAAADLDFAVLVADIEGESEQRVVRLDFSKEEREAYRKQLDKVWLWVKPENDRRLGRFR